MLMDPGCSSRGQVKRALMSGSISELKSAEAWEQFDTLVIDSLVGNAAIPLRPEDGRLLQRVLLEQPLVVSGSDELKALLALRNEGRAAAIDSFLSRRAKACLYHWKRMLGVRTYRPSDRGELQAIARGARQKDQGQSWPQVASEVYPSDYADESRRPSAVKRVRTRILYFRRARKKYLAQHAIAPALTSQAK